MAKRPPSRGQLNIEVPSRVGVQLSPDELFGQEYGSEKLAEQQALYTEARRCTYGSPYPNKWGKRWKHVSPCPRAGRKF